MKPGFWLAGLGTAALVASCSGSPDSNQAKDPSPQSTVATTQPSIQPGKPQSFPNPVTSPTAVVSVRSVPGLLTPTNASQRVPTLKTGRQNPFEAIPSPPIAIPVSAKVTTSAPRSSSGFTQRAFPQAPTAIQTVPIAPNSSLLPPLTASNSGLTPLPPIGVSAAPPSRTSLAEAIEVTGVLQVKGKWKVIVKEPGASTSRYVKTGDYLANGSVLVKRILSGAEPVVILQQNGVEVYKSLGSSAGTIARS